MEGEGLEKSGEKSSGPRLTVPKTGNRLLSKPSIFIL